MTEAPTTEAIEKMAERCETIVRPGGFGEDIAKALRALVRDRDNLLDCGVPRESDGTPCFDAPRRNCLKHEEEWRACADDIAGAACRKALNAEQQVAELEAFLTTLPCGHGYDLDDKCRLAAKGCNGTALVAFKRKQEAKQ